jgi:nicotinamide-nucleotide amidase
MWNETVAPALTAAQSEKRVICHRRIKCFGVGESDVEAMLPDMIRRKREPVVGITVSGATITLRITASGPNKTACRRAMEPTVAQIREILGVLVFGDEDDEAAGDSKCMRMGIVVRDTTALKRLLQIDLSPNSVATPDAANAMARAAQQLTGAEYGLGIAAFPTSGPEVPTAAASPNIDMSGTLHVALAAGDNVRLKSFPIAAHPAITKTRSAKQALNMLRLALLNRE